MHLVPQTAGDVAGFDRHVVNLLAELMPVQPLRVCVGHGRVRVPGFLSMDERPDADISFAPGDEFPFTDRVVERLVVAGMPTDIREPALFSLLLQSRRVLVVNGMLRIVLDGGVGEERESTVTQAATAIGLCVQDDAPRTTLPVSGAGPPPTVLDFIKPDRQARGEPLVSIVIPAYREHFFRASLSSALRQSYGSVEVLVCDDSRGEAIRGIVREHEGDTRVRYLSNPSTLGSRANYRQGLVEARGEFIKFLNDDDTLRPTCVERLLGAFRHTPDVVLATSHRQRIDELDRPLPDQAATMPIVDDDAVIAGHSLANVMLMTGLNVVGEPSTVLFRKRELEDLAPDYFRFRGEQGRGAVDMTIWSTLLLKGDAVYLRESLSTFRIHAGQQQSDAQTVRRSAAGVRGLRTAWRALGLHRRIEPYTLLAKRYPIDTDADWVAQRVRSFQRIDLADIMQASAR